MPDGQGNFKGFAGVGWLPADMEPRQEEQERCGGSGQIDHYTAGRLTWASLPRLPRLRGRDAIVTQAARFSWPRAELSQPPRYHASQRTGSRDSAAPLVMQRRRAGMGGLAESCAALSDATLTQARASALTQPHRLLRREVGAAGTRQGTPAM